MYNNIAEASKNTNIHHSHISCCLSGKQKSAGGYLWVKENEDLIKDYLMID